MKSPVRALRTDARRNRRVLLDAAREVMAEQGLSAPLDDVARAAGVGNATLYRHFPSRCDLVTAVFSEQMIEYADAAHAGATDPDPWAALCTYLGVVCALQTQNRGFADLLTSTTLTDADPTLSRLRRAAHRDVALMIDRAQSTGQLRADATAEDIAIILIATAGVVARTARTALDAPGAAARLVALILDGMQATAATTSVPAPSPPQLLQAMRRRN
jgi:AcrR family transcriptional regulator